MSFIEKVKKMPRKNRLIAGAIPTAVLKAISTEEAGWILPADLLLM